MRIRDSQFCSSGPSQGLGLARLTRGEQTTWNAPFLELWTEEGGSSQPGLFCGFFFLSFITFDLL